MSSLQKFQFNSQQVRTTIIDGEPWFVASDLCSVLSIKNSRHAMSSLDTDEKGVVITDTLGGAQRSSIVSESGMYSLVLRSRKDEAATFRRWVTKEVLPSIRRTGSYSVAPAPVFDWTNPAFQRQMLTTQLATLDRAEAAETQLAIAAPKVAGYDSLMDASNTWSLKKAAHLLCNEGFDTGQNKLFEWMRENGWVCLDNSPRQDKINAGFLQAKIYEEPVAYHRNGQPIYAEPQSRVTPKGLDQLRKVLAAPQPRQLTAAPIAKANKKKRRSLPPAA